MTDLRTALATQLSGHTCLVGIGNTERGDDAFGVRLAEVLRDRGYPDVCVAGMSPERWVEQMRHGFSTVLLLDAVRMGQAAGTAVLLDAAQLAIRYPQVSTHTLSLGTLARLVEAEGPRVLLLGVEPDTLNGSALSASVRTTLHALADVLMDVLGVNVLSTGGRS
ncbi:MAG TPA: hydrogenase maturation protease [Candidatus Baltobacteraceae bacterium]|nr:hydrogenase maturation protease [Candidatus Baltobacteraceae bacterium]